MTIPTLEEALKLAAAKPATNATSKSTPKATAKPKPKPAAKSKAAPEEAPPPPPPQAPAPAIHNSRWQNMQTGQFSQSEIPGWPAGASSWGTPYTSNTSRPNFNPLTSPTVTQGPLSQAGTGGGWTGALGTKYLAGMNAARNIFGV